MPSTVSQACGRAFKHLARPYEDFAHSLKNPAAAMERLRSHEKDFVEDKNMGLVMQVMERLEMRRIADLKETYITISLVDVAKKIGPKDRVPSPEDVSRMESLILRMVLPLFRSCLSPVPWFPAHDLPGTRFPRTMANV